MFLRHAILLPFIYCDMMISKSTIHIKYESIVFYSIPQHHLDKSSDLLIITMTCNWSCTDMVKVDVFVVIRNDTTVKGDKSKGSIKCMNGKGKIITNPSYKRQHKCDSCMYCDLWHIFCIF